MRFVCVIIDDRRDASRAIMALAFCPPSGSQKSNASYQCDYSHGMPMACHKEVIVGAASAWRRFNTIPITGDEAEGTPKY